MSTDKNQNPEQIARDKIDSMLSEAGWAVQSKIDVDLGASKGVAVREYQAATGFADYVLFVDRKPVGIIEAKKADDGHKLTVAEYQVDIPVPLTPLFRKVLTPLFRFVDPLNVENIPAH